MVKEEYIQICPICGGKKFSLYKDDKATEIGSLDMYKCSRCENIFAFPLELTKKEASKLKEVKLTPAILRDTPKSAYIPVGKFEVGVYWKILGVILMLFGIAYFLAMIFFFYEYPSESTGLIIMGFASLSAGSYLLLDSFVFSKENYHTSRTLKIGLVLAMLIIIMLFGTQSLTIFTWP